MADTNLKQIVFNKLSTAKYEELKAAGQLNANEFYITPDESVTQDELTTELAKKADKETTYTKTEVDAKIAEKDSLPTQDGQNGKFLSTNGTDASWEALPDATDAVKGIVKIANDGEITAGTSTTAVVSAKSLKDVRTILEDDMEGIETELTTELAKKAVKTEVDTALALKADKSTTYTKTEVDAIVASAFHYKGSKPTVADLPSEDNKIGDVWNVEDTGANYAWTGSEWDKLSETIDLSGYFTKEEVNTELAKKADKSTTYTKTEVDEALALKAVKADVDSALALKADKTELTTELAKKADKETTYTKTEVDGLIEPLAVKADVDTELAKKAVKTEVDSALALKADKTELESLAVKADVDDALALKADKTELTSLAVKTEVNAALALKANSADVYTKAETDTAIENRVVAIIRTWDDA